MFEDYEDTEIGALDCDEIEGHMDAQSQLLLKYAQDFEEDQKKEDGLNFKIARLAVDGEESEDISDEESDEDVKENGDCKSILSKEPKISKIAARIFEIMGSLLRSPFECINTFSELSAFEKCAKHVSANIILGDMGVQNLK